MLTTKFLAILALALPVMLAVFAFSLVPLRTNNLTTATLFQGVARGATILLFLLVTFFILPQFRAVFVEFGLELPWTTEIWLGFHRYAAANPLTVAKVLLMALVTDVTIFFALLQKESLQVVAKAYSGAGTLVLTAIGLTLTWGLASTLLALVENLS